MLGPHLIHVTESMQHACFPLPSFSWLASQLNKHSLQLHAHTPFTAQGPAILTFPNSTAAALTNLSATISPQYQVFRQLEFYQDAANASPTEEDAKHYRAAAAENFALIRLRAGNERWEKLVFDSAALETLLQNIAGDFISFGITARSFEARLDLDLRELSSIIRTQLEEEEVEVNWREEDIAYRSAPITMDIDNERFEQIVQGVDNVIHSAQAFIRTWRRGVDELSKKQATARAQLEPFITAMSSEEKAVGFEGLELGAFYTPWMKGQLSQNRIYDPHCREDIPSPARGFWLPETEDRFLIVREMTDIVNDLENRWDAVVDHLKRMNQGVRVRARRTEKGWKDGWTWTSWIR